MSTAQANPAITWAYHIARVIFGGWWLYSGAMPFIDPAWQPLGQEQAAIDFSLAMINSGLMVWVKVAEIVFGILILANRMMPLAAIAVVPINFVILYWNFVLDEGYVALFEIVDDKTVIIGAVRHQREDDYH